MARVARLRDQARWAGATFVSCSSASATTCGRVRHLAAVLGQHAVRQYHPGEPTSRGFPGNRAIERRIKSIIRWNAMAMVVRANREESGIGGHISTYASAATLYEVGFNHFFRGKDHPPDGGDQIYFQGHASPGIYARAFLEGRHERAAAGELPPRAARARVVSPPTRTRGSMPDFWEYPTVSMGLGPIMAIYQARFNRATSRTAG